MAAKSMWRVSWNLKGSVTRTASEFTSSHKAVDWAAGVWGGGATKVVIEEFELISSVEYGTQQEVLMGLYAKQEASRGAQ